MVVDGGLPLLVGFRGEFGRKSLVYSKASVPPDNVRRIASTGTKVVRMISIGSQEGKGKAGWTGHTIAFLSSLSSMHNII